MTLQSRSKLPRKLILLAMVSAFPFRGLIAQSARAMRSAVGQPLPPAIANPAAPNSGLSPALTAKIDATANRILTATGVPSASIAIVKDGRIAYLQAYGLARISPPIDAEPRMQYPIGSVSKQFTAAAMLLLAEKGKLSLDDPIGKYLPELTRADEVTIRMVLSHTSGYQDYWPEDYLMTSLMVPTTPDHILEVWGKKPLDFDPGTQWQYSNTNYVIAGRVVELVSGVPLLSFLEKHIFAPLAMDNVYNSDASRLPTTDPVGYYRFALGPLRPAPLEGTGWMFAAGELAMPAHDLALWDVSLIEQSVLRPASYRQMFTPVLLKNGKSTGYGLGVELTTPNGHAAIAHSGEVSGFVSENVVFPADHAAIVVLTNEDASTAAGTIARQLTPLILSIHSSPPTKAEQQALAIFTDLQDGKLNRTLLTPYCNAYFLRQAIDDFANSLKPLGPPISFTQKSEEARGGMIFRAFTAEFPDRKLTVTTYEMPDGKLEQYIVSP
jgi:CubicO group peptidase (beta-lactamase class C family)